MSSVAHYRETGKMNIWVRILATLVRSLFQPKIEPTALLETDMIVGPTEADLRFVGNARYMLFMEIGRLEQMLRTGILRHARRRRWSPLVVSQTIRYVRPLRRFQRFTLKTRLVAWDDRWFFIEHKIERRGQLVAFGVAKCCFRGPEGVVPPASAFAAVNVSVTPVTLPRYATLWTESEAILRQAMDDL
jgi:hypothetical protein